MNIQDVAKKAGVSIATVSRVLNETAIVSEDTKNKVLSAINELNYHPNLVGRNLRRKETKIALVIMNSVVNSFFAKIIKGIEDSAAKKGYNVMICTTDNKAEKINKYLDLISSRLADGAILLGISINEDLKDKVCSINDNYPILQCSEYNPELYLPFVTIDNFAAAYDATSYLIKKGRKKILHISNDNDFISSRERLDGYKKALSDNDIPFNNNLVIYGNYGYRNALKITTEFLQKGIKFDGLFANSDRMAAGAMRALSDNNIKVPLDVCVIGFDNTDLCYMHKPGITSVSQSQYEMGLASFEILHKLISNEQCKTKLKLEHKLILRESTNI